MKKKSTSILDIIPDRNVVQDPNAYTTSELSALKGLSVARMGDVVKKMMDSGEIERVYVKRGNRIIPAYRTKTNEQKTKRP